MGKSHPRSVRLDEEVVELIEQQIGETFTQKLETLVYNCYWMLPAKDKELKAINKEIERRQAKLRQLMVEYDKYSGYAGSIGYSMKTLSDRLKTFIGEET